MAKKELTARDNWQTESGSKALSAEKSFYKVFEKYFRDTDYILHKRPKYLKKLYAQVQLSDDVLSQIYNPPINRDYFLVWRI